MEEIEWCVDIVEAVRHGKKRGVPNGCDEDGGRHLVYEFCLLYCWHPGIMIRDHSLMRESYTRRAQLAAQAAKRS
jgi:hypothetical protein